MARTSDPAKAAQWQRRLHRFDASSLSVARFCQREKVSVASFYHWRKKLAGRTDRDPAAPPNGVTRAAFRPVHVMAATPAVTVHLPGGARLEVPAENLTVVRTVIDELVRIDRTQRQFQASTSGPGGARHDVFPQSRLTHAIYFPHL